MGVGFKNTCTESGKWNISKVVRGLCWWVYKIIYPQHKAVIPECSLRVTTIGSQPGDLRSDPRRKQILSLLLWILCSNPMEDKVLFCLGILVFLERYVIIPDPAGITSICS